MPKFEKLNFQLITPERVVAEKEIDEAIIPTQEGLIGVLPNHTNLVALLHPGEMILRTDKEEEFLAVGTGSVEIMEGKLIVLADAAQKAEEIDETKAEEARKKAEDIMEQITPESPDYAAMMARVQTDLAWARVAKRKKYRKGKRYKVEQT